MDTAQRIIERASYVAKVPGYAPTFGLECLNSALEDICLYQDFALARGLFHFNFNPGLGSLFGSGPYPLPLDYLRTSGSSGATGAASSVWFLYPAPAFPLGQPIVLVPCDLAEFDVLPQLPTNSLPEMWMTDMGGPLTQRVVLTTTGDTTGVGPTLANCANLAGLRVGLGVAGEGIEPGSTIAAINSTTGLVTLSHNTTGAKLGASVWFGVPPVAYVYPPPLGPYPVTCRYQRMMPQIAMDAVYTTVPWFPDTDYLVKATAQRLTEISDDERSARFEQMADKRMQRYAMKADDRTNRS